MTLRIGIASLLAVIILVRADIDLTRMEREKGADVVQAVVDQVRDSCIFPNDRLFLRRLAFVESQDGMDPKTYRNGYNGGIWQVDEIMFKATHTCPPSILHLCDLISTKLNIDWKSVQWRDLLKPLYSGLAAALYIQLRQGETIPGDLAVQSVMWQNLYHPQPPIANFSSLVQTSSSCNTEMDIVFIVDSSGSIGSGNFRTMLTFLQKVVSGLHVSREGTHVSIVRFSTYPSLQFPLNRYYTEAEINHYIQRIVYDNGGTYTASAIHEVMNVVFTTSGGARKDAAKVAVLLTDGASNSFLETTRAAEEAKNMGITFFTVGIGNVNPTELSAVASEPNCTHYFLLKDFSEIESILYEMQRSACRAPVSFKLDNNKNGTKVDVIGNIITKNSTTGTSGTTGGSVSKVISITPHVPTSSGEKNSTDHNDTFISILTTVNCGVVYVYASYDITHPGPAFHDIKGVATGDLPSVMYVDTSLDGRPLYIAYSGENILDQNGNAKNCSYKSAVKQGPPEGAKVICRDENGERECTLTDFVTSPYNKFLCRNNWEEVPNPCTTDAVTNNDLYHPHPYDNTKFIKCDLKGDMYVTQCPGHKRYIPDSHVCGTEHAIINNNKKPITSNNISNPCTVHNIRTDKMFFPFPGDLTKYIHCSPDGTPWENSCQNGFLWFQDAQTCSPDYQHQHVNPTASTFTNPCTKANMDAGRTFFIYAPDRNKYVECGPTGIYYIRSCPLMMHFDVSKIQCVRRDE